MRTGAICSLPIIDGFIFLGILGLWIYTYFSEERMINLEASEDAISEGLRAVSILLPSTFIAISVGPDLSSLIAFDHLVVATFWFVISVMFGVWNMSRLPRTLVRLRTDSIEADENFGTSILGGWMPVLGIAQLSALVLGSVRLLLAVIPVSCG